MGPPPDDVVAIQEITQQQLEGAHFLAVVWHAFWWLQYYQAFREYLYSRHRCVLENERVVVFDLGNNGV